jgi:hypothetical protein
MYKKNCKLMKASRVADMKIKKAIMYANLRAKKIK